MLLERERERAEIGHALAAAQQGRGQIVLVEASARLGKSSLLRATSDTAAETGFACLRTRASELERDFADGCVRKLLKPVVANASEPDRQRRFDGAASLSEPLFSSRAARPTSGTTRHLGGRLERPDRVVRSHYGGEADDLPADVYQSSASYPLTRFTLDDKAGKELEKLCS